MSIRKSISKALRQSKVDGGHTYLELEDGSGCSRSSIRYALNGGNNVSLDVYQKLFDYMEVSVQIEIELCLGEYE